MFPREKNYRGDVGSEATLLGSVDLVEFGLWQDRQGWMPRCPSLCQEINILSPELAFRG